MYAKSHSNNGLRSFVPHRLFSRDRSQNYRSNKELGFGRQLLESEEDFNACNTMMDLVISELVSDGPCYRIAEQYESLDRMMI
jgi:hypothetical protein